MKYIIVPIFRFLWASFYLIAVTIVLKSVTFVIISLWNFSFEEAKDFVLEDEFYTVEVCSITQYYYKTYWDMVLGKKSYPK